MLPLWKLIVLIALCVSIGVECSIEEEEHGVIYANRCEACKILANELEERLKETGKSHDVIETGYGVTNSYLAYASHFLLQTDYFLVFLHITLYINHV